MEAVGGGVGGPVARECVAMGLGAGAEWLGAGAEKLGAGAEGQVPVAEEV